MLCGDIMSVATCIYVYGLGIYAHTLLCSIKNCWYCYVQVDYQNQIKREQSQTTIASTVHVMTDNNNIELVNSYSKFNDREYFNELASYKIICFSSNFCWHLNQ